MIARSVRIASIVLLCGCTAGQIGRLDPDGNVLRPPDGGSRRFDASARDGGAIGDGGDGGVGQDAMMSLPDGSMPPLFEVFCDDGVDQDGDGRTDCEDEDCDGASCDAAGSLCEVGTCGGCRGEPSETACGDGEDDDCDGLRDCADSDCEGVVCGPGDVTCTSGACPGCPSGFEERICDDGTDDDCDGLVDCADGDCLGRACGPMGLLCLSDGSCGCGGGTELCQDVDDDCDGTVDEGCPVGVGSCCETSAGSFGGSTGTAWVDACPPGAALIGIAGIAGTRVDQLQPICAATVLQEDDTLPEHTFSIRRGAAIYGAAHGAAGTPTFEDRCPEHQVVIGVRGHADLSVDQVQLQCASLAIQRGASFAWTLQITPEGTTPARGGAGAGAAFAADCPAGFVVTALDGRASTRLDRLGVTCRQLQIDLR